MVKKLIFLILFLSFISFNYAANCGGNVTCQCGDTIVEDYEMSNDLVCSSGTGLNFASNVELDCNGHSIIGSGSGIGLYFYSYDNNNVVDNCVISNFDKGVHFNYYKYNTNTYFYPQLNVINNSEFINNNYGIYSSMGKKIKLFSNIFKNNSINSIYLDGNSEEFTISNNKIYDVPIDYRSTGSHSFCQDGIANELFNLYIYLFIYYLEV